MPCSFGFLPDGFLSLFSRLFLRNASVVTLL